MKKLITLLLLAVISMAATAQEDSNYDQFLGYDYSWWTYESGTTNATNTTTDSTWSYTILKESHDPVKYDKKITLDSVGGTARWTRIYDQIKTWESDTFVNLDTITWTTGADTTIRFQQHDTARYARYNRTLIVSDTSGFQFRVSEHSSKYWK
jgi:hypothetical protein